MHYALSAPAANTLTAHHPPSPAADPSSMTAISADATQKGAGKRFARLATHPSLDPFEADDLGFKFGRKAKLAAKVGDNLPVPVPASGIVSPAGSQRASKRRIGESKSSATAAAPAVSTSPDPIRKSRRVANDAGTTTPQHNLTTTKGRSQADAAAILAAQIAASHAPQPLRTSRRNGTRNNMVVQQQAIAPAAIVDSLAAAAFRAPAPMTMFKAPPAHVEQVTPVSGMRSSRSGAAETLVPITPARAMPLHLPDTMRNRSLVVPIAASETPMIRRNRDFREKRRRSSLTKRGQRASSLLNSVVAVPHVSVPDAEFYRHIASDLPPPARMKALLMWSLHRESLETKNRPKDTTLPRGTMRMDTVVDAIARDVQAKVLQGLVLHRISTTWYSREVSAEEQAQASLPPRPNPANEMNRRRIATLTPQINRLAGENELWIRIMQQVNQKYEEATAMVEMREGEADGELRLSPSDLEALPADVQIELAEGLLQEDAVDVSGFEEMLGTVANGLDRMRMAVTRQAGRVQVANAQATETIKWILQKQYPGIGAGAVGTDGDAAEGGCDRAEARDVLRALSRVAERSSEK